MPDKDMPISPVGSQTANRMVQDNDHVTETELADRGMLENMVRRPTEEDFVDVLSPEGNASGDIAGTDVGGSSASNDSLGGI